MSNWILATAISTLLPVFGAIFRHNRLSKYWLGVVLYTTGLQASFLAFHFSKLNSVYLVHLDYLITLFVAWIGIKNSWRSFELKFLLICSYLIHAISLGFLGIHNASSSYTTFSHLLIILTAYLLVKSMVKNHPINFLYTDKFWIGVGLIFYFLVHLIVSVVMWQAYYNDNQEIFYYLRPLTFFAGITFNLILTIPAILLWNKKK